ncbi:DUF6998 domain-containing protein [Enterococcus hulanensis]|uniref:DUF6998 domain-containing protein n=1 Tax=Enterococcus hulanensis TaxID=2559929 RepID=UPI0010F6A080|nr:hypothetical protein [Enterococcus hulanensis]
MSITQKDLIHSLSKLLDWLEQERDWGTNSGELKFITGRIGEIYTAIMVNGQMAENTNQKGYDVVSEKNERISVKARTKLKGQVNFNSNTLDYVDRVIIVFVDVEEITVKIIYDASIDEAKKIMTIQDTSVRISMSKIVLNEQEKPKEEHILNVAEFEDCKIVRLESGKIEVYKKDSLISPSKTILRTIAQIIGVDIMNSNGNKKNQRQLGYDVIRQLEE